MWYETPEVIEPPTVWLWGGVGSCVMKHDVSKIWCSPDSFNFWLSPRGHFPCSYIIQCQRKYFYHLVEIACRQAQACSAVGDVGNLFVPHFRICTLTVSVSLPS